MFNEKLTTKILEFQKKYIMSNEDAKNLIISLIPEIKSLFLKWVKSPLRNSSLTTVGIAIGAANLQRKSNEKVDLSIWTEE